MVIIVGLGNPGLKFKNTPHNLGFMVMDNFKEKNNFPDFKLSKKFNAETSESLFNNEKIILAKPQTFMNESGKAVKKLIKHQILNLVVVHDDIDLPLGKIKVSVGRGSAGHKGVESIIKELSNKEFIRVRVGIRPEEGKPQNPESFVLRKFDKNEEKTIKEIVRRSAEAIKFIIVNGQDKAMNEYN